MRGDGDEEATSGQGRDGVGAGRDGVGAWRRGAAGDGVGSRAAEEADGWWGVIDRILDQGCAHGLDGD